MNILYKKDGNQKYAIITDYEDKGNGFKINMLLNNKLEGIIPFTVRNVDNKTQLWYDTTSYFQMSNVYSRKLMSGEDVFNFIKSLKSIGDHLREYLLDINDLWFNPDMVYVNREEKKFYFCYNPEKNGYYQDKIRDFFDQLLQYIDHNDKQAVLICYGIQQITIGEDFTLGDLLDYANEAIQKKEPEIEENKNVDICYRDLQEKKNETWFDKLKKFIHRETKYVTENEMVSNLSMVQEESEYDNMTVLLTNPMMQRLSLRGDVNDSQVIITPKVLPCIIGSSIKSSDFYIDNPVVSRVHMRILEEEDGYYIEDLNSTNGTFLNEEKLKPHQTIKIEIGDLITIANINFVVE